MPARKQVAKATAESATKNANIRLPRALLARADALIPALSGDAEVVAHGVVKQSTVLRLAMMRGLDVLEQREREKRGGR